MSSPSTSSSATAGRLRWRRPSLPSRSSFLSWGAAAVTAAALYLTPSAALASAVAHSPWPWAMLAACVAVLVAYTRRGVSPLFLLGFVCLLALLEFAANLGTAAAERCGGSALAGDVEAAGAMILLLVAGAWGVRSRRMYILPLAVVVAAVWVAVVAHVIPGGAGACFD